MVSNALQTAGILIYLYLILACLGIGLSVLIMPSPFRKPYLYPLAAPSLGFCLLAVVGSWVLPGNVTVVWTMIVSLVIATAFNLCALWRVRIIRRMSGARFRPSRETLLKVATGGALLLAVLLIIVLPGIRDGTLTTPLRTGPDPIGYAGAAQSLADGETLSSIADDLKEATGEEDLEEAKTLNFQILRFDLHCSSEFLLKALRWGYPVILASMTWATGLESVYQLDFVLPVLSWALLMGLVYCAGRSIVKAPWPVCLLLAAAMSLNCNLLNTFCEGSYAQVMATPILFWLLLYGYHLRQVTDAEPDKGWKRQAVFVGFLCAGLLSIWNEAFILLAIVCGLALVLDLLLSRRLRRDWLRVFVAGGCLAFCMAAPLTLRLVLLFKGQFTTHLENMSAGGWWQPHWAVPAEILSWVNIYARTSEPYLAPRDTMGAVTAYAGTAVLLAVGSYYVVANRKLDLAFWLAPIMFVLLIYAKCVFWDRTINYQYYKAYTVFLPIFFLFAYAAIFHVARSPRAPVRYAVYGLIALTLFLAGFNGVSYVRKFHQESTYLTREMAGLQKDSELLSQYVVMASYGPRYTQVVQLAATANMHFYNFSYERDYKKTLISEPYLDLPVAVFLFDLSDEDREFISPDGSGFLFSGEEFVIAKTAYRLRGGLDDQGRVEMRNYLYRTGEPGMDGFTKLLLHCDGTDGSTKFRDEARMFSGVTAMGDTYVDATQPRFGTGSAAFDGAGDFLDVASTQDFDFGSGDFTIDGWFCFRANDTGHQFLIDRRSNSDATGWALFLNGSNELAFLSASASGWDNAVLYNTGTVPPAHRWVHIAVVRQGNVFTMYLDGTAVQSGTYAGSIAPQTTNPTIGAGHATPGCFNGYMDELRISKGIARWTADFTPPAAPY